VLGAAFEDFLQRPAAVVQAQAGAAVAFGDALQPQEDFGIDGLRAAKAAPQPPGHGGEQEQRQGADDE